MHIHANPPTTREILTALQAVADALDVSLCWYYRRAFHFVVDVDWTVAITPESAGRLRIETCRRTVPHGRTWTRATDHARLKQLVRDAVDEVLTTA